MLNALLYISVVLIWGTTWIAITAQQGVVSAEVSIFWRFVISAGILWMILFFRQQKSRFNLQDHLFCGLQGMCVFGLNFLCFYTAVAYLNSGLESVIFSLAVLFNAINSRIFFATPVPKRFYPAAILGFLGMLALFWHDIQLTSFQRNTFFGIGLCILGTLGFSFGNMISTRHQRKGLDVFSSNAYAMSYGAAFMAILALIQGHPFLGTFDIKFVTAVLYLAILGSVVGFSAYFILVGRIGAGQAAYSTLLFPLIALTISTFWEGYVWTPNAFLGIFLILLGNLIFFVPWSRMKNKAATMSKVELLSD
ncbi:DMT family transporter [Acinetobacter sp. MD2(2019)]|uniref:DMT family transporter n=1 Tax=Acinetobacter sp. MD2(2019) TaxID=2605273 RepID=UPI002D1F7A51|nr:DMT family transporter [Acinetobacter sp. MD2(2019)]MEB3754997.1 DMT family transporter [Acinetobacter sp. MD2(2019)]